MVNLNSPSHFVLEYLHIETHYFYYKFLLSFILQLIYSEIFEIMCR